MLKNNFTKVKVSVFLIACLFFGFKWLYVEAVVGDYFCESGDYRCKLQTQTCYEYGGFFYEDYEEGDDIDYVVTIPNCKTVNGFFEDKGVSWKILKCAVDGDGKPSEEDCEDVTLMKWSQNLGSTGNYEQHTPGEAFNTILQIDGDTKLNVGFECTDCEKGKNVKSYVLNNEEASFKVPWIDLDLSTNSGKATLTVVAPDQVGTYKLNIKAVHIVDNNIEGMTEEMNKVFYYEVKAPEAVPVVTPATTTPVALVAKTTAPTSSVSTGPARPEIPSFEALNQLETDSIQTLIGNIIKTAMGLMGSIALAMFVYGGLLWMTAVGNAEQQKKATNVILWSSLGLMVILSSYVIVEFVFGAF